MRINKILLALTYVIIILTTHTPGQILRQADLRKTFGNRWVVLPFPDSRIVPGAIISVKKGQVSWESILSSCGAPASVLQPVVGSSAKINFNGESEYGADAVINIKGVEAGPEFSKVKKATLKVTDHGPEGLDRISLGEWFNDPNTKLSKECSNFLNQKDVYIVQEAYKISKGRYTLYGDTGAKLSLSGLNLGIIKIGANARAKTNSNGEVEFDEPVFVAIRRLKRFSDGELKTLISPGNEKTRDAEVRKILYGR